MKKSEFFEKNRHQIGYGLAEYVTIIGGVALVGALAASGKTAEFGDHQTSDTQPETQTEQTGEMPSQVTPEDFEIIP